VPNTVKLACHGTILLYNNCGFYGDGAFIQQLPPTTGGPVPFFKLADPYATGCMLKGLTLDGGWTYTNESDAALFKYSTTWPPANPAYPDVGAQIGQPCLYIVNTFSGINDAQFIANSIIGSQVPRHHFEQLTIASFGGDGIYVEGAGGQVFSDIQVSNVGGRGICINSYDDNFQLFDIGGTGLEGMVFYANGTAGRFTTVKAWFTAFRRLSGHIRALWCWNGGDTMITGLELQDSYGDGIVLEATSNTCIMAASLDWQGVTPANVQANSSVLIMRGGANYNIIDITTGIGTSYQSIVTTVLGLAQVSGAHPTQNTIAIQPNNFASSVGGWNAAWLSLTGGAVLDTNTIQIGGAQFDNNQLLGDSTGRAVQLMSLSNGPLGRFIFGSGSTAPGLLLDVCQGAWSVSTYASSVYTTLIGANTTNVTAYKPLTLASFTTSTVPGPWTVGTGALIFVTDAYSNVGAICYSSYNTTSGWTWRKPDGTVL
jgi:hypothetical protein